MAKPGSTEQCSPVDPNYEQSTAEQSSENYVGAKEEMDHPLTRSTVDPNYGFSPNGPEGISDAGGGPKPSKAFSKSESDDMAGVAGGGGSYTDDEKDD